MAGRAFTIPSIFTAVDRVSATVARMGRNVQNFATKAEVGLAHAERGFRGLITPLTAINKMLRGFGLFIGGYLLIRLVGGLISIFSDFQQANANLAAVMGNTVEANKLLSDDAKRLGLTTAKTATEVVGLQIELAKLGFVGPQILAMTESIVSGSIAMDSALDRTALLAGAMVRTFDKFSAADTPRIMNQMALATLDTALSFSKLETSLPIVSGAANALGISFTRELALLGKLSDAGIDAHMSATSLRNIFIDSRRKGHSYQQVLENIAKRADTLTPAFNKFGRRTAVSANILIRKLKEVEAEDRKLQQVDGNFTSMLAEKRLNTFKGSVILLKSAYQGLVLSIEDGTGAYAHFLTRINQVARATLLLVAGNDVALKKFGELDERTQLLAKRFLFWIKAIAWVVAALVAAKVVLVTWSILLGTYNFLIAAATAATWLWNAALAANPIGLIIIGIGVLIISVTTMIAKWNEWGAAMSLTMGPLGAVVSFIQALRRNWDGLKKAFTDNGFWAGFSKLGLIILDSILMPLQQVFKLIAQLTGFDWATKAVKSIESIREKMAVNVTTTESGGPLVNPVLDRQQTQQTLVQQMAARDANVRLFINDPKERVQAEADSAFVKIQTTSTHEPWWKVNQ